MRKIGILHGRERAFPQAVLARLSALGQDVAAAEPAVLGGVTLDGSRAYDVVLDRISHEFPYYRAALAKLASDGARIVPDPRAERAPDRFQTALLASRLGVPVVPRAVLPPREHPIDISSESLANLLFPLDWDRVFATVGFPALLRPLVRRASEPAWVVKNPQELFDAHAHTGSALMVLEALRPVEMRLRALVVGMEIRVMRDEPEATSRRYAGSLSGAPPQIVAAVVRHAKVLAGALGHDVIALDFSVSDRIVYLADAPSLRPLAEPELLGEANFAWLVEQTARHLLSQAAVLEGRTWPGAPEDAGTPYDAGGPAEIPAGESVVGDPVAREAPVGSAHETEPHGPDSGTEVPATLKVVPSLDVPAGDAASSPVRGKATPKAKKGKDTEEKAKAKATPKAKKGTPKAAAPHARPSPAAELEPLPIIELDEADPDTRRGSSTKSSKKSKKSKKR